MGTHAIHVVLVQKASSHGEEDDTTIKKTIQIWMRRGLRIGVGRNSFGDREARATLSYMAQAWLRLAARSGTSSAPTPHDPRQNAKCTNCPSLPLILK
jgi:hypothetical protein